MAFSGITLAEAVYDNQAEAKDELSFSRGEIVTIIEKNYGAEGWWLCQLHDRQGIVPFNYVRELTEEEIVEFLHRPHYVAPTGRAFQTELEKERRKVAKRLGEESPPPVSPQVYDVDVPADNVYSVPPNRTSPGDDLRPAPSSVATAYPLGPASSGQVSGDIQYLAVGKEEPGPTMTLVAGQQLLQRVNTTLDACSAQCTTAIGQDAAHLEGERLHQVSRKVIDAGRDAHAMLKDLISLSYDVLLVARQLQKAGHAPQLGQLLVRPIMPIKNAHVDLASTVAELERGADVLTSRQLLVKVSSLLTAVRAHVDELRGYVLSHAVLLFLPAPALPAQDNLYEVLPDDRSLEHTPKHHQSKAVRDSPDGGSPSVHQRSASCELLERRPQEHHSPTMTQQQRQTLVKRPSQVSDGHLSARSNQQQQLDVIMPAANRSGSVDSVASNTSATSRHSSSSSNEAVTADETLKRRRGEFTGDGAPAAYVLAGLHVTPGDLTDGELSLLAYYAERMETLIPSVTNAVEAFCRAISEKQVPKQFVWHSKMVVVGAYKMVYVADTVFQKLAHAELRNHIVACSNRLVDSIKNIVEFTKVAAQQYPSVGAMRDMVESVSHLPPLALDLAESIKEAASLR